ELIAREFSFDRGSSDAKEKSVPACDEYAESAMAFAPPSEEMSTTLIKTLAQKIGVTQVVAPEFSTSERDYLSGYISGLQASAKLINAVPTIPLDAPIDATHRTWINGLLAGMFSRTFTIGMPTQNSTPKLNLLWASQTGNAESLAETFAAQLNSAGWNVSVQAMDDYAPERLAQETHLVLVTSTFG